MERMMRLFGICLVATALAACGGKKDSASCTKNSDCPEGGKCDATQQVCFWACQEVGCSAGHYCDLTDQHCSGTSLPLDPEFQNVPPGAWTVAGGAVIDPNAAGLLQGGNLVLSKDAICTGHGNAHQIITMPSFADVSPMAINVTSDGTCVGSDLPPSLCSTQLKVSLNGHKLLFSPNKGVLTNEKRCLGAAAFGGPVTVKMEAIDDSLPLCSNGPAFLEVRVDRVEFMPDPSCPTVGTIPDADFEDSDSNWSFANGSIQDGAGVGGSRAAHLLMTGTENCAVSQGDYMAGIASFPPDPTTALQLALEGTTGQPLQIADRDGWERPTWATVTGSGTSSFQSVSICIPEYVKGMVNTLGFSIPCSSTPQNFYIDDLAFTRSTSCPADASVIDGGFELSSSAVSYWTLSTSGTPASISSISIDSTAGLAHQGNNYLTMSTSGTANALAVTTVSVPREFVNGGPAVRLFYKYLSSGSVSAQHGLHVSDYPGNSLPQQATYTQATVCLDPSYAGEGIQWFIQLVGESGIDQSVLVDDISVTTDPSCPMN